MTIADWILLGVAAWLAGLTFVVALLKAASDADDRTAEALKRHGKGKGARPGS